jgi:chromosome partitioning protein
MIISFLNQKGGVGKTTLSIHIAANLSLLKYRVLLVDADVQGSAFDWAAIRKAEPIFNIVGLHKPILHKELKSLSKGYDFVIIDGPPRVYDVARSAIVSSDLVLIPIQPSPYDVWAAKEVVDLIEEVSAPISEIKKIERAFVVNRKITNTAIGRDVIDALEQYKTPVLSSHICQRISYAESAAEGLTVMEDNKDQLAIKEINLLTNEILDKYYR